MEDARTFTADRIEACLARRIHLTLGEIEMLQTIRDQSNRAMSLLEQRELQHIERKLGLA